MTELVDMKLLFHICGKIRFGFDDFFELLVVISNQANNKQSDFNLLITGRSIQ